MVPFTLSLLAEVEVYLTEARKNSLDIITITRQTLVKVKESCDRVTHRLLQYEFNSVEDEIYYFKEIKPLLFSRLIYNKYIFQLEISKPPASEEIKRAYFIKHLNKLSRYFREHEEFFYYIQNKDSNFDEKYFTKCKGHHYCISVFKHEGLELIRFSSHDISVARILAYKRVEEYIIDELRKSVASCPDLAETADTWKKLKELQLRWTASQVDLIELVYALHRRKCINHGDIEIKTLIETVQLLFGVTIKDVYRVYADIKSRHHRTKFLDSMRESLDRSIEEEDTF